jgi:hypothetical protein
MARRKWLDRVDDPTGSLRTEETRRTSAGSKFMGKYQQKTMRLDPEAVEAIKALAQELGITISAAERWIVARGLQAYYQDGETPTLRPRVTQDVDLPSWEAKQ